MVATARALDAADAALVLQLHDELVWDVDERRLHHVAGHCAPCVVYSVVSRAMSGCGRACGLRVSLPVSLRVGRDWAHMEPYSV